MNTTAINDMTLTSFRKSLGLTQTQAANIVNLSLRSWQRYETGEQVIPKTLLELFIIKNSLVLADQIVIKGDK